MKNLRKTAQPDLALKTMEEIWRKKERLLSTMIPISDARSGAGSVVP